MHPEEGDSSLNEQLRVVYTAEQVPAIETAIARLINKYRETSRAPRNGNVLGAKDVMLITYGDTLNEQGAPPLEVLHRFHSDYLRGVFDLVHILPFHPYTSDDGFSVVDYFAVREDLGDWSDIESLASDCRIMADAVINHVSSRSGWFEAYLAGDPGYEDFFIDCDPETDLSRVVRPRTSPLLTEFEDAAGRARHIWTTFSADQVDLNYANPAVLLAVIDVLFFLISKGARLLRMDAVTFLWKEPGTPSANMVETHALIKVMRRAISELRDDVVVVTETNVPHHENVAYFGNGHDEAHMVYNFALPPLLAYSFVNGDGRRLSDWAAGLALPSDEVCFLNFSASHDGVGVRPVEEILEAGELQTVVDAAIAAGGRVSSRRLGDGQERPYELNCTFLDLISSADDDDDRRIDRFVASQAVVLSMPGVPAIYIQSLLGTRNDLSAVAETGRARSINRSRHLYADVVARLADENSREARIFNALTRLARVRRDQAAFDPYAPFEVIDYGPSVFAIRRGGSDFDAVIECVVNVTSEPVTIEIADDTVGLDLVSGDAVYAGRHNLEPYAVLWVRRSNDETDAREGE